MQFSKLLLALPLVLPSMASAQPSSAQARGEQTIKWSGCYGGVVAGYVVGGKSHKTNSVNVGDRVFAAQPNDTKFHGPAGGIDLGCNLQLGSSNSSGLVIGPEIEGWFQDVHGTSDVPNLRSPGETIRSSIKSTFAGAASLRIGYSFNNVLVYGKGGAAFTTFKHKGYIFDDTSGETVDVTSNTHKKSVGYLLGGGAEVALSQHWSSKLEYNYMNFGRVNTTYQISLDPGQSTARILMGPSRARESEHFLKVGFVYRF